ncbi:MAG: DUF6517 family protein [Natronomonas sp.]
MQLNRRTFVASVGALAGTTIAGCSQLASDEPLEFEATPAQVPDDVLAETGYQENEVNAIEIERSFDVAGDERTVTVTNQQAEYEKQIDADIQLPSDLSGPVYTTLSTPKIEILGQELNPVADMSNEELLERLQNRYDRLENVEVDTEDTMTVLGEPTTRTRFLAETRLDGNDVELYLHVSNPVENGEEFVASAGVHPRFLPDEESEVLAMMEAIQHGD